MIASVRLFSSSQGADKMITFNPDKYASKEMIEAIARIYRQQNTQTASANSEKNVLVISHFN